MNKAFINRETFGFIHNFMSALEVSTTLPTTSLDSLRWVLAKIEQESEKQKVEYREAATRRKGVKPLIIKKQLPFQKVFSEEEYRQIILGSIPLDMDYKWFIFFEDNQLYFHRSWTGICIYQLELEKRGQQYFVEHVWVNRDPEEHEETDDDLDLHILSHVIKTRLLGEMKFLINIYDLILKDGKTEKPFIRFFLDSETQGISGFDGCSIFLAEFEITGENIKVFDVDTRVEPCKNRDQTTLQSVFSDKLIQTTRYEIQGKILKFFAGNKLLLTFEGRQII